MRCSILHPVTATSGRGTAATHRAPRTPISRTRTGARNPPRPSRANLVDSMMPVTLGAIGVSTNRYTIDVVVMSASAIPAPQATTTAKARLKTGTPATTAKGNPQATRATTAGVPTRARRSRSDDRGAAISEPTPAANIRSPTPALPACSRRMDAMTATASHMPRTKVRSPLITRMPPRRERRVTWAASTTRPENRAHAEATFAGGSSSAMSSAVFTRKFKAAAATNKPAAPANTTAGVVTARRVPPATPPRAWLKVFTVLVPVAEATSSWGLRARKRTIRDWAGLYWPEAAESSASNTKRTPSGAPAATRAALAANPRARAVEINPERVAPAAAQPGRGVDETADGTDKEAQPDKTDGDRAVLAQGMHREHRHVGPLGRADKGKGDHKLGQGPVTGQGLHRAGLFGAMGGRRLRAGRQRAGRMAAARSSAPVCHT